jgi:hypothetical protein
MESSTQEFVWIRAKGRCEYCQLSQEDVRLGFEIDHIIARKHRGPSDPSNLCLACSACNNHKGTNISGFDVVTGKIVPLYNPRHQRWAAHFRWDGPVLNGLTPTGRVTVYVLEINLAERIDVRHALIDEGRFPPSRR